MFPESRAQFPGQCFAPLGLTVGGDVSNHVCFCPGCASCSRVCYGFSRGFAWCVLSQWTLWSCWPCRCCLWLPYFWPAGSLCSCDCVWSSWSTWTGQIVITAGSVRFRGCVIGRDHIRCTGPCFVCSFGAARRCSVYVYQTGAYGRLLLANHKRMMTGGLPPFICTRPKLWACSKLLPGVDRRRCPLDVFNGQEMPHHVPHRVPPSASTFSHGGERWTHTGECDSCITSNSTRFWLFYAVLSIPSH